MDHITAEPSDHPKPDFPQLFHKRLGEDSPTHLGFDPLFGETALDPSSSHRAEATIAATDECSRQTIPAQRVPHRDR